MRNITDLHTANDDRVIVGHTNDGMFERPAVLINPYDVEFSMDLFIQGKGIYHVARLNVFALESGNFDIDVCLPDDAKMDVLSWHDGAPVINVRNSKDMVALVLKPSVKYAKHEIG